MTRGEEFERLQFRATRERNNSLLESLFHADCTYESNLVPTELKSRGEENIMWDTLGEEVHAGTQKVIYESKNQIHVCGLIFWSHFCRTSIEFGSSCFSNEQTRFILQRL